MGDRWVTGEVSCEVTGEVSCEVSGEVGGKSLGCVTTLSVILRLRRGHTMCLTPHPIPHNTHTTLECTPHHTQSTAHHLIHEV